MTSIAVNKNTDHVNPLLQIFLDMLSLKYRKNR